MAKNEEFVLRIETQKSIVHCTTSALDKAANRPILARIVLRVKLSHEKYHVKRIYYSWVIPSVRVHPPLFAENYFGVSFERLVLLIKTPKENRWHALWVFGMKFRGCTPNSGINSA